MKENRNHIWRKAAQLAAITSALILLGGCNSFPTQSDSSEGIGYRDARFEAMSAVRDYRSCVMRR